MSTAKNMRSLLLQIVLTKNFLFSPFVLLLEMQTKMTNRSQPFLANGAHVALRLVLRNHNFVRKSFSGIGHQDFATNDVELSREITADGTTISIIHALNVLHFKLFCASAQSDQL